MHPNTMQRTKNMSLGSNRVDSVSLLRKIPMWLRGTNFFINCTSSQCFAPSFMQLRNDPKCTQTLCNAPKHEFRVQWIWLGALDEKNPDMTFALIAPVDPVLHRVSCSYEMIPNASQHFATHQNMSLGSNAVDWVRSLKKSRCDFVARTFALIAPVDPVLHRVSCSYETIPNASKHYATYQNMSLGSNGADWMC